MPQVARFASVTAALVGACAAVSFAGCSALVSVDGLAGAADATPTPAGEGGSGLDGSSSRDASDAGAASDAPTTTDAPPDADTHVGPNLLDDSSFEGDCTWNGFQGISSSDPTARTGSKSCRICTSPTTTDYFTGNSHYTSAAPLIGATYRAVAWVRKAPGAPSPGPAILNLRTLTPSPFTSIENTATDLPGLTLTDTWQRLEILMLVTKSASNMDVYVGVDTAPNSCFLIDDVWLEKLP